MIFYHERDDGVVETVAGEDIDDAAKRNHTTVDKLTDTEKTSRELALAPGKRLVKRGINFMAEDIPGFEPDLGIYGELADLRSRLAAAEAEITQLKTR